MSVIAIVSLISLYIIVPRNLGNAFISVSFKLSYGRYVGGGGTMEVIYVNGSIVGVDWIGLRVKVTNRYFTTVRVKYNGFDYVYLIYNHTVTDPSDVEANKDFLVWGGYFGFYLPSPEMQSFEFRRGTGYEYYVARRNLSNYTYTIDTDGTGGSIFDYPELGPIWYAQDLHGYPASPQTYYIYCVAFGKTAGPTNLTVTSVLWE